MMKTLQYFVVVVVLLMQYTFFSHDLSLGSGAEN